MVEGRGFVWTGYGLGMQVRLGVPIRRAVVDAVGASDLLGPKSVDWEGVERWFAIMYVDGSGLDIVRTIWSCEGLLAGEHCPLGGSSGLT